MSVPELVLRLRDFHSLLLSFVHQFGGLLFVVLQTVDETSHRFGSRISFCILRLAVAAAANGLTCHTKQLVRGDDDLVIAVACLALGQLAIVERLFVRTCREQIGI